MARMYKDKDGCYLGIEQDRSGNYIAWYLPEDGDFGVRLSNENLDTEEHNIAVRVATEFFKANNLDFPNPHRDFYFESEKQARDCLRRINIELLAWQEKRPLPEWAKQALAAGWKAPKNWKP